MLKGEFFARVIDGQTGKIRQVVHEKNVILTWAFSRLFSDAPDLKNSIGMTYDKSIIVIHGWNMTPDLTNLSRRPPDTAAGHSLGGTEIPVGSPGFPNGGNWQATLKAGPIPAYVERTDSWTEPSGTSPGDDRITRSLSLEDNSSRILAYVQLSAPCIQRASPFNDQLIVTYRMSFIDTGPTPISDFTRTERDLSDDMAQSSVSDIPKLGGLLAFSSNTSSEYSHSLFFIPHIPENGVTGKEYLDTAYDQSNSGLIGTSEGTFDRKRDKVRYENSFSDAENVGVIFGSIGWAGRLISATSLRTVGWSPATPDDFPNKPIQVIHNHNAAADKPFLDTLTLASGQGTFTLDGSSWTGKDTEWPQFWRIDIVNTGDVGTSRYFLRRKDFIGYTGNDYSSPQVRPLPWFTTETKETFDGPGNDPDFTMVEYDKHKVIVWDGDPTTARNGITIVDLITGAYTVFDGSSSPVMAAAFITQIEVDANKDIWVADRTQGLFKITDPLGSPSVSLISLTAPNGSPPDTIDDTKCYGVAEGNSGSIWAMFEGTLAKTTDGGTTWTHHYPGSLGGGDGPNFDFSAVTSSNWGSVQWLEVDRDTSQNELGFMYAHNPSGKDATIGWWSEAGTSYTGPVLAGNTLLENGGGSIPNKFRVSKQGGFWAGVRGFPFVGRIGKYTWSTASEDELNAGGNHNFDGKSGPLFVQDYYGNPFVIGQGFRVGGQPVVPSFFDKRGTAGQDYFNFRFANRGPRFAFEENTNGLMMRFASGNLINGGRVDQNVWLECVPRQQSAARYPDIPDGDPLNVEDSPLYEFVWQEYRYNPGSMMWELNYHTTATDSSLAGNTFHAARHRFYVENHYFNGRSAIDASAALAGNFTADDMTLLATVDWETKSEHRQNTEGQVVFALSDGTLRDQVALYITDDHDAVGSVILRVTGQSDHVFGASPTAGPATNHRVALVISGTSATCYVDGSALGSAATIPAGTVSGASKLWVGATTSDYVYGVYDHIKGTLSNVQVWNVPYTGGDITSDHTAGDPWSGVVAPGGGTENPNLVARYELTQSLAGLETKTTHVGAETLLDGITIAFANGASSPAFVDTNYYTFGVLDGILKDNSNSFDLKFEWHYRPVIYEETDIEDTVNAPNPGGSPVISASGGSYTDTNITWRNDPSKRVNTANRTANIISSTTETFVSFQRMPSGSVHYFEWKVPYATMGCYVGVTGSPPDGLPYSFHFRADNDFRIRELGVDVITGLTYNAGDTFKIQRDGVGNITWWQNGGLLHTSSSPELAPYLWGRFRNLSNSRSAIYDMKMVYIREPHILDLGNSVTLTGKYHPDLYNLDDRAIAVTIGGSPATVVVDDDTSRIEDVISGGGSAPGPGTCVAVPDAGILVFNPADVGSAVTASYTVIKTK